MMSATCTDIQFAVVYCVDHVNSSCSLYCLKSSKGRHMTHVFPKIYIQLTHILSDGWLSRGVFATSAAEAGNRNDVYTVYSNSPGRRTESYRGNTVMGLPSQAENKSVIHMSVHRSGTKGHGQRSVVLHTCFINSQCNMAALKQITMFSPISPVSSHTKTR